MPRLDPKLFREAVDGALRNGSSVAAVARAFGIGERGVRRRRWELRRAGFACKPNGLHGGEAGSSQHVKPSE